ncbi:transporter, major facilitator family protein [Burkholderia cenocepacia BC7]|nr:transporter, major facilitator family protein [Burkholderia cenocepacia K56-2Valvano]ERI26350.1 transporter, major facilitator family protein [Burkholderia cenocepacia BC7]CDN63831.1 Permeases of the major facilitator superfamily [Burkholderia cenocepacia H111]
MGHIESIRLAPLLEHQGSGNHHFMSSPTMNPEALNSDLGALAHPRSARSASNVRRAVTTAVLGQILEWYDFFLYGTAAALVFGKLFFPVGTDPLTGTIAAFGGFTVGFIARPIGGVLCGHIGDRYGRKAVMTLTLLTMGTATVLMGVLPTYRQVGIAAPVMLVLLRILQGLAAGGEWSGSILLIHENAPRSRRGALAAWSPCGAALGFVLSTGAFLLAKNVPADDFHSWGWRLPFLASAALVVLGLWMRRSIGESAAFAEVKATRHESRMPVIEVLRQCPREVLTVFGLRFGEGAASYLFFAFSITYAQFLGITSSWILGGLCISMLLMIPVSLFFGWVTDKVGRKPVYLAGAIAIMLVAWPYFVLLGSGEYWKVVAALILANSVTLGILQGAQPAFISEMLPVHLRFSGLGIGREVSSVLGGGLSPMIATALLAHYHSAVPVAIYLGVLGLVTVVATLLARETFPKAMRAAVRQQPE